MFHLNQEVTKLEKNSDGRKVRVSAGTALSVLIHKTLRENLTGLEWAAGIPGTVGGAVAVNASAFGEEMKNLVSDIKRYKNIILSVELKLKKNAQKNLIKKYFTYRRQTQPLDYPSAGCIFKNPSQLGNKMGAAPFSRGLPPLSPLSAGYLIDQCGLKGKKIGQAMISEKHANFIVNCGPLRRGASGAKAKDVIKLIQLIKKTVQKKFNLDLEEEIEYLPKRARQSRSPIG